MPESVVVRLQGRVDSFQRALGEERSERRKCETNLKKYALEAWRNQTRIMIYLKMT